jgi:hypothetical protein
MKTRWCYLIFRVEKGTEGRVVSKVVTGSARDVEYLVDQLNKNPDRKFFSEKRELISVSDRKGV